MDGRGRRGGGSGAKASLHEARQITPRISVFRIVDSNKLGTACRLDRTLISDIILTDTFPTCFPLPLSPGTPAG